MLGEGVAGSQPMSTAVHNAHGALINSGDLTPYLTYMLPTHLDPVMTEFYQAAAVIMSSI